MYLKKLRLKHHKKIFEKKSFFRWISFGGIFFLLLFQFFSLYQTYINIGQVVNRSIEKTFVNAIKEHRSYRMSSVEKNSSGKISVCFNKDTVKTKKEVITDDDVLDIGKASADEAMYKVNSYLIAKSPINLPKLDSIYARLLEKNKFSFTYDIILYKKDSVFLKTDRLGKFTRLQHTPKKELDFNTEVQAVYKNPFLLIFERMLWFFITSVILILIVSYALVYQLRLITRQKKIEKIRRDFVDSMSHELRHPLQGALSMAEVLENLTFSESVERRTNAIKRIQNNLFNLSNLLESIVQKSYSNELQQSAQWETNNLKEMLNDLVANFTLLSDKPIKFITHFESIKQDYYYDPIHFPNAIKNLIDNAIKYSNDNIEITISVINNKEDFVITVADTGIGISQKELPNIFNKFYRVYDKNRKYGFGLGLSYVKWVADIHSGKVSVSSKQGKGSEFSISVPFVKK